MRECTVISRRLILLAGSKSILAGCFAATAWLYQMAVALRFTPKLLSSTTHPRARKSMWKVRSNPVVEGAKASRIRRLEPVLVPCWAESSAGARELGLGRSSGALPVLERLHSMDTRRSHLAAGRKY